MSWLGWGKHVQCCTSRNVISKRPSERDIVCMLPASLKDNYMKDLLKCGNNVYRQINYHKMNIQNVIETCNDGKEYLGEYYNLEYLLSEFKNQSTILFHITHQI